MLTGLEPATVCLQLSAIFTVRTVNAAQGLGTYRNRATIAAWHQRDGQTAFLHAQHRSRLRSALDDMQARLAKLETPPRLKAAG